MSNWLDGRVFAAWQLTDHLSITATMLFIALATPALIAIRAAVQASDKLDERFGDKVSTMKSRLDADHALPAIAALAGQVHFRSGEAVRNAVNEVYEAATENDPLRLEDAQTDLRRRVENVLLDASMRPGLTLLAGLFLDRGQADRLKAEAATWARWKGVGAAAALVGLATVLLPSILLDVELGDPWLLGGAGALLIGVTIALMAWHSESRVRQELSELCERYA